MDGYVSQATIRSDMKAMRAQMRAAQSHVVTTAHLQRLIVAERPKSPVKKQAITDVTDGNDRFEWRNGHSGIDHIKTIYASNALEDLAMTYA
jgi:hypothetical protein